LEKLRAIPERFAAAIEPMRPVDPRALSGAWEVHRDGNAAAFSLGMALSERVVAERGREQNRLNALAQKAILIKAIEEVCEERKRKASATIQCARDIRNGVRKRLIKDISDLQSINVPLDETARKVKARLNGRTWPSKSTILGTISKFKAAEKAGVSFLQINST
jgi:hypothetical protein